VRYLYLDDSGKTHAAHPSKAVLFAGFSVSQSRWHPLVRDVTGAKARFFPSRGHPARWEMKGADLASPGSWGRNPHRDLCFEIANILGRNDCRVYSVGFIKANSNRRLQEPWIVPLCFQVIAAKFACELEARGTRGHIVCDWSSYPLDHQVSASVQAYVLSRKVLRLTGGVTFGSSQSLAPIQVADVIAYTLRTATEGATHHADFASALRRLLWIEPHRLDVDGFPIRSEKILF